MKNKENFICTVICAALAFITLIILLYSLEFGAKGASAQNWFSSSQSCQLDRDCKLNLSYEMRPGLYGDVCTVTYNVCVESRCVKSYHQYDAIYCRN